MFKSTNFKKKFSTEIMPGITLSYQKNYPDLPSEHIDLLVENLSNCLINLFYDSNNNYILSQYKKIINFLHEVVPSDTQNEELPKFKKIINYYKEDTLLKQLTADLNEQTPTPDPENYIFMVKELRRELAHIILSKIYKFLMNIYKDPTIPEPFFLAPDNATIFQSTTLYGVFSNNNAPNHQSSVQENLLINSNVYNGQ